MPHSVAATQRPSQADVLLRQASPQRRRPPSTLSAQPHAPETAAMLVMTPGVASSAAGARSSQAAGCSTTVPSSPPPSYEAATAASPRLINMPRVSAPAPVLPSAARSARGRGRLGSTTDRRTPRQDDCDCERVLALNNRTQACLPESVAITEIQVRPTDAAEHPSCLDWIHGASRPAAIPNSLLSTSSGLSTKCTRSGTAGRQVDEEVREY